MTKRRLLKSSGFVATLAIFIVGISPGTFTIPLGLRPWFFLASIVGFLVFIFRNV